MGRRIILVLFSEFELLDLAGPTSVFATASREVGGDAYEVVAVSISGGPVISSAGLTIESRRASSLRAGRRDTVLVVGGPEPGLRAAMADKKLQSWLRMAAGRVERYGSICSGTFLLAAAQLLAGRRATTHWDGCRQLQDLCPETTVEPDALYVRDGRLWTSAGVTTGIDMALALVEADHGPQVTKRVAQRLVVSVHRPGHQSQFSAPLEAQKAAGGAFSELIAWIEAHLHAPITVPILAARVHMSERTFYRRFKDAVGVTPSRWLEQAKLEEARRQLEEGAAVGAVAHAIGFQSEAGFRTAFEARFGLAPSLYRSMHRR